MFKYHRHRSAPNQPDLIAPTRRKYYLNFIARSIAIVSLVATGSPNGLLPLLATPTAASTTIDNQATGTFTDEASGAVPQSIMSNVVSVKVAEVTGITISAASTPTATTGSVANFDFTVTNVGNDPTKFFLPSLPSAVSGGTVADGSLTVIAYINAAGTRVNLTTPVVIPAGGKNTGALSDPALGGNTTLGSIPAGAAIIVRVPVNVTATTGNVSVTLGQTTPANTSNTPYIAGTNDVYTVDNADSAVTGETVGSPINGVMEASFTQITPVKIFTGANVILVKRITAINGVPKKHNGDPLDSYEDTSSPYDDNTITIPTQLTPLDPHRDTAYWPTPDTFLLGSVDGGYIKPMDSIEYTIYFLSAGDGTAHKVLFCDRVPKNTTFIPTAYNSLTHDPSGLATADRGIAVNLSGTIESYTNVADGDVAQYFPPNVEPSSIYPNLDCGGANDNGAVVVNLGDLPNATTSGQAGTYGFVRFQGQIK